MCPVSRITCHVSCVTCHMSHIKKQDKIFGIKNINNKKIYFIFGQSGQSGGAIRWRVCYQRGLLRLVLNIFFSIFPKGTCNVFLPLF